jgi:hypothetical protein
MTMTPAQLEAVHDALVQIVDSWNDAAADEDRGRSNDALCLTLYDDGSGRLGRRSPGNNYEVEDWHDFSDLAGLLAVLRDAEHAEIEPNTAVEDACDAARTAVADLMQESSAFLRGREEALRECIEAIRIMDVHGMVDRIDDMEPRKISQTVIGAVVLALMTVARGMPNPQPLPPIQLRQRETDLELRVVTLEGVLREMLGGVATQSSYFVHDTNYRAYHTIELIRRARELLDGGGPHV